MSDGESSFSIVTVFDEIYLNIDGVVKIQLTVSQARELQELLAEAIEVAEDYSDE